MKQHYLQIDILKGLAIVAVIILHSLPKVVLHEIYAVYHVWQAVPMFMIIMGLNAGIGLAGKQQEIKDLYTAQYFTRKASRILIPFLLIFLASYALGSIWEYVFDKEVLSFSYLTLTGLLPVPGNGNYFITLLLQSILLLPIIGYCLQRRAFLTTLALVLTEAAFLHWSKQVEYFNEENYLYSSALPRYFTAIAYGYWMSRLLLKTNYIKIIIAILVTGILSIVYLYLVGYTNFEVNIIREDWKMQNFLSFGYAALLVGLGLWLFPKTSENKIHRFLARLGLASYHIFLVQTLYFGLVPDDLPLVLNLTFCTGLGYTFYLLEKPLSINRTVTANARKHER